MFLAQVFDVAAGGFEDAQAEEAEQGDEGEVAAIAGLSGRGE